jgi:protein SCO1/2
MPTPEPRLTTHSPAGAAGQRHWAAGSAREQIHRRNFPDVELRTHEGKRVRLYEDLVRDKIVALNFFYATCQGICVPLTSNLVRVQQLLGERMGRDIFFCSFTLKPELDSVAVLGRYARRFQTGAGWSFLTGDPRDLELCRRRLGFTNPDPVRDADKLNHTGMVRFGNEPLTLWSACPGLGSAASLAHSILSVDWYGRRSGTAPAAACPPPAPGKSGG